MSSHNCASDVDPKQLIALVGTDRLDGTELDNVTTGLTPPSNSFGFFDNQCSVDSIGTPMRFDEEDNVPNQLECQNQYFDFDNKTYSSDAEIGIRKIKDSEYRQLSLGSSHFQLKTNTFNGGYSSQFSSICLDDILPIIHNEHVNIDTGGLKNYPAKSMEISDFQLLHFHSWDGNNPGTSKSVSNPDPGDCPEIESVLKPKKQFICTHESCNRKFNRSDELNRHSRVHSGIKPYTCEFCFKKFARSDHLKTHRRTHTGERPFECDICQKTFARSDEKSRHVKTHTKGRELSRIFTVPNFERRNSTGAEPERSLKQHRSSDGSINYKL